MAPTKKKTNSQVDYGLNKSVRVLFLILGYILFIMIIIMPTMVMNSHMVMQQRKHPLTVQENLMQQVTEEIGASGGYTENISCYYAENISSGSCDENSSNYNNASTDTTG